MKTLIPILIGFIDADFSIREWVEEHMWLVFPFAFVVLMIALFVENKKLKSELEQLKVEINMLKEKGGEEEKKD
jgi:hypothetical protein